MIRVLRFAGFAVILAIALFCATLLAVRLIVFPRVETYRGELTAMLTQQLGQPVEIDALATGWDGWNPKLTVHGFRVRNSVGADTAPLLELPVVDMIVAWTSLPVLDLRLKQLVIERPRLAIRRDRAGVLHIAGIEVDPGQMGGNSQVTDWLLRQPRIYVRDALITWNDDLRNAPQLVLDQVQFRLESRFGRHRFGLRGTPPAAIAAPIDVRGDIRAKSTEGWKDASGKLYARLDYADIAAWSEWLPLPAAIASGKGAVRMWLDFGNGDVTDVVADLGLADVRAQLARDLPELELASLSGRAGWRVAAPRREFTARQLAFVTKAGLRLEPTDFTLTLRDASGGNAATGLVEFDRIQLAPLREFAVHLPLPERLRADLALYAPRGTLTRGRILWEGAPDSPGVYSAVADFADVGVAAQRALPGAGGLTGRIEMTQAAGAVRLASRNAEIELPSLYAAPIPLDTLAGEFSWERKPDRTTVRIERLEFANADAAGNASGWYRTQPSGPGDIDFNAQLTRASAAQVARYLPLALSDHVRGWLKAALTKGTSSDVRFKLQGRLADFPFPGGKGGQFVVTAKARDAMLDYAKGWPPITDLDGDVRIEGTRLTIDASRGVIGGLPLAKVKAEIANLDAERPVLRVEGGVTGPTTDFLHFIDASPVAGWIDHMTDGAQATGNGRLQLDLTLPLGDPAHSKVAGDYQFIGNDLRLAGVPALTQVDGTLQFTESEAKGRDIAVEVLGGPAKIALGTADGRLQMSGAGATTFAALRREFNPAYGDALSGTLDWTIAATLHPEGLAWTVESNLKGSTVDLPAPLGKTAGETVPLKVERRGSATQPGEDTLDITYGRVGRVLLHRKLAGGSAAVDRGLVLLGSTAQAGAGERADRPGIWIRGELPVLNFDDWLTLQRQARPAPAPAPAGSSAEPDLMGVDLTVGALEAFGRRFNEMKVGARHVRDDWRLELESKELAGTATWSAPSANAQNGRFFARLSRLVPPGPGELVPWKGAPAATVAKADAASANSWPEINVEAESYFVRGRDVGRLEFVAHPRGTEWQIDKLALSNDGGRLDADGRWQSAGRDQQTKLDVALDLKDAGKFLSRIGYADALQNAPTKVKGQLSWAGAPTDFDYPSLTGAFRIDVGPGRFTKIEPGIGKLLGVLSLQSLPRRITLDFTDVFSEGFAFDEITGDMRIQTGVLRTDNLRLSGPAAKVMISGEADLAKETQQLNVRVQPALSSGVSAGAALLFLANPLVGAAVGAGALLAQKVLRDPIEQMFSYDYVVTGSWSDPIVARRGAAASASVAPPK